MGEIVKMEKPKRKITKYKILKVLKLNAKDILKDLVILTVVMKDNEGNKIQKDLPFNNIIIAQEIKKGDFIELEEVIDIEKAKQSLRDGSYKR